MDHLQVIKEHIYITLVTAIYVQITVLTYAYTLAVGFQLIACIRYRVKAAGA
jgi:hypothetical protein